MKIGDKVITLKRGKEVRGTITGEHGNAEYYAVELETGEVTYRFADDLTVVTDTIERIVTYDGKQYRPLEDAYINNAWVQATAICLQDIPDGEGYQSLYLIVWLVKMEYIGVDSVGYPYLLPDCPKDTSTIVGQDTPYRVIYCGSYNAEQGRIV